MPCSRKGSVPGSTPGMRCPTSRFAFYSLNFKLFGFFRKGAVYQGYFDF
jgi:hypothetical protein